MVQPAQEPSPAPIRVLLVDDDEDSYLLTRHFLSKIPGAKYQLDWASSYEAALSIMGRGEHDVYLLDYRLGGRTGLDLLTEALAFGCRAPIIILTTENPEVDGEAMRLGAADFLSKDKLDSSLLERSIRYSVKHFQALRQLQEREAQINAFMKNVPCAVFMKDLAGRYLYVNETCAAVFHRRPDEIMGRTDAELLAGGAAAKARHLDQQVIQQNHSLETTDAYPGGQGAQSTQGTQYWLTNRFPICDPGGRAIMIGGAAINITETRRLEREIQEVSEREKRRIGQDLHDGLGQYLTGIACMVKVVEQKLTRHERVEAGDVQKITTMVNETISQARDLARGLCPVELEINGLQAALQELADGVTRTVARCQLEAPTFTRVYDNAAAVHLYRIAQEAVNNAIKHGRARNIVITLRTAPNQVELIVEDDGVGLPKSSAKTSGMGLRVMKYRAAMIGAAITVGPGRDCGTQVHCVMPNRPVPEPAPGEASTPARRRAPRSKKRSKAKG